MKIMETEENKYEKRRFCGGRRHRALWIALGIAGVIAFAFLFGAVIMWLWNWLMPVIFHLGVITYWQAVGLAILGRLLFGSMHHGGHHSRGHHRFGPWRHRHPMGDGGNCRDYPGGTKWSYYEQFWNEEGEHAFNEYVKRKSE
jgi:predicted tellurium resistance membrane protein TerC